MRSHPIAKIKLTVAMYKEGKQYIAFCPALDLSAYGESFEKAKKDFEETLAIFLEETEKRGTLERVLVECGWVRGLKPHPRWTPPQFITNIEEEIAIPV